MSDKYPTGPATVAEGLITSATDPVLLALYAYLALVATTTVLWGLYKKTTGKQSRSGHGMADRADVAKAETDVAAKAASRDLGIELSHVSSRTAQRIAHAHKWEEPAKAKSIEIAVEVDGGDHSIEWKCYHNSLVGTICFSLLVFTSFLLIGVYFAVIVDYYWDCQLTGVDTLCFYGSYPISGGYDQNSAFFFALWFVCLAFYLGMLGAKTKLRNFFRVSCNTQEAQFIWVWIALEDEVLMKNATALVKMVRRLKHRFGAGQSGYEVTIPVLTTENGTKYYELQATRYVMGKDGHFHHACHMPIKTYGDAQTLKMGLRTKEAKALLNEVGPNAIPFKPDTILEGISGEFFSLFYLYQLMVYMVWIWFSYLVVGAILALVVLVSGAAKIIIKRLNQQTIAALTRHRTSCQALRDGEWATVDSEQLVPGDVVRIQEDWVLPCDLVIAEGACVCNESALTGEAMPVQKVQVPREASQASEAYDTSAKGKRHTLFAGTTVLQASKPGEDGQQRHTTAVVTGTAINTSKGEILSAILFPSAMTFRYDEELPVVVALLSIYAVFAFSLSLYLLANNGQPTNYVTSFAYAIFTVSQILSPLLPVALIAGQVQATVRLSSKGIFCINPTRIAIAGKIRVFCFDKTGTLTTDSLEFLGARQVANHGQGPTLGDMIHPSVAASTSLLMPVMMRALASCHAVAKFGATFVGNQVEVKMFESTGWDLVAGGDNTVVVTSPSGKDRLTIVRRFEFDHARQTMSVVVRDEEGGMFVFSKGSFEKIAERTRPYTIPDDYHRTAKGMALEGCYVLAVSMKSLGNADAKVIAGLQREAVEKDLDLMGLIAFRNELKGDTRQAILDLKAGDVRPVMITGDNAQCGHYIANGCGMAGPASTMLLGELQEDGATVMWSGMTLEDQDSIKPMLTSDLYKPDNLALLESGEMELAVTGRAYDELVESGDLGRLMFFVRVFARVTPTNKINVVRGLVDRDLIVGMCGDGGNDCGALREAHAGVALSDAEASVVSPFTSKGKTCASVVDLLKEGKAALHTNIGSFKFLIMYGQLFSVWKLTAFYYGVLPSMMCYLMVDVICVVGLTYALTCARPKDTLQPERPTSSLFSASTLASILGNLIINLTVYVAINVMVPHMAGYVQWPSSLATANLWWLNGDNWESTGIYWPIYFQFITSAFIFGFGAQYKKVVFLNWQLTGFFAVLFFVGSWVLLAPSDPFTQAFHVASEQFNYLGVLEDNPSSVWAAYQAGWFADPANADTVPCVDGVGQPCAPDMSSAQRTTMYVIIMAGLVVACLWQWLVVDNYGKLIKHWFPNPRLTFGL